MDVLPYTTLKPSQVLTSSVPIIPYTSNSTTVYLSNEESTMNASVLNVNMSFTETSSTSVPSTMHTIITNESSNSASNQTIFMFQNTSPPLENFSRRIVYFVLTKQVPPCRIFYSGTLFFQDDKVLIVIDASKFETIIDMQIKKRQIIIDGFIVYTNCQRTLDIISSPIFCYLQTSS